MLKIDPANSFMASWNASNAALNPNVGGVVGKLAKKIKNFVFYLPSSLIAVCINPRKETAFHAYANNGSFAKQIVTPDGVRLAAQVELVNGATAQTPTAILFNPLGAGDSVHEALRIKLIAEQCNVVTFNYRGLGTTWRPEDLVVDGDSIYQYATEELGVQSDKICFYGFSLGGALAAQVKALHPESTGKYAGDRPFKSVFSLIKENCCIARLGGVIKKITSFISAIFLAYPVYLLEWEWMGAKRGIR